MSYNLVTDSFHTKNLCSRLSSREVRFYTKNSHFVFESTFGSLGAMYDDHLRLIVKRIADILLVLVELFSLGVMAEVLQASVSEYWFKIGDFTPMEAS